MRLQTVLIWVVVAGLLAGVVALTRSGPGAAMTAGPETPARWTVPIDPARVASLRRTVPDTTPSTAERTGPDTWTLRWTDPAGQARSWSADPGRIRAALRLLGTAEITLSDEPHEMAPTTTLQVTEADGRSVEIWFGARAAGGQTPVVVVVKGADGVAEKRVDGRIGSGVPDAFVRTDWSFWRDPTIFDAGVAVTDALAIQTQTHRVRVQRTNRGWAITEPFAIEADAGEIERTMGVLQGMKAASFDDSGSPDSITGLDNPIATVRVESRTGMRTLEVGGPAESTGGGRFGRITAGEAVAIIRLDPEALGRITAAPEAYARRTTVALGPGDIAGLRLTGADGRVRLDARRGPTGAGEWTLGDASTPASRDQRDAIDRVVRVLTAEPAARVAAQPRPGAPATSGRLGTLELLGLDGGVLATLRLRTEPGADAMRLLVSTDLDDDRELVWTHATDQAKGVVAWAAALTAGG
jgi:hypothetical protein